MTLTGNAPVDIGRRSVTSRRGRGRAGGAVDPVAAVVDAMARQGFEPTVRTRGDRVDVVLGTCPFAHAAMVDPDTVCAMHLGIAQGVAELTGGRIVVDELVPHDSRRAKCRLRLHLEPDDHDRDAPG